MLPRIRKHRTLPRSIMNDFFNDDFLPRVFDWDRQIPSSSLPAVNVEENNKSFEIEVAAPGWDKKDINVTVDDDVLIISSAKESKSEENNENFIRQEFNLNSFSRSFTLPENADASKIKASHKNGVLHINIPKVEVEVKKAIEIKVN